MTQEQRSAAFRIAEDLDYTGFEDVRVNQAGRWISPASTAMTKDMKDSLVFVWQRGYDIEGEYGCAYRFKI